MGGRDHSCETCGRGGFNDPDGRCICDDESSAAPQWLDLEDRLDDLLAGFRFWRDHKVASCELTTLDEALIRWVEHNERDADDD